MPVENGVNWEPIAPEQRGRHPTLDSAVSAALKDLLTEHDPFFDSLADLWPTLFPKLPIRPGRFANGVIFLYVSNAPLLYTMRPKLAMIKRTLAKLPNAPKRLNIRMEIHAQ